MMVEKKKETKSEINAKKILRRCHVHDFDSGGVFTLITGCQGSGKTSTMLSFVDYTLSHCPDEKVFFSNTYHAPLQSFKIGNDKHHIIVKQGSGVTFHDRRNKLKQVFPHVTEFSDMDDLWDKARPGMCNCVFFGDRYHWMDFIHYLRSVGEWVHIYIDELSEISPAYTKGKVWKTINNFSKDMKEVRKCMMNVHTNTQSVADIDHRIRSKVMIRIYLPGATYFFSPISMPKEGDLTTGFDTQGGLHEIPGTSSKVYFPSWAKPKEGWTINDYYHTTYGLEWVSGLENIRNYYFMFYRPISNVDQISAKIIVDKSTAYSGDEIVFDGSSSLGEITSYTWEIHDGPLIIGIGKPDKISHQFRGMMNNQKTYTISGFIQLWDEAVFIETNIRSNFFITRKRFDKHQSNNERLVGFYSVLICKFQKVLFRIFTWPG